MSEISTYISSGPGTPVRPGSPGRPQPGRRVVILPLESGENPLPAGESGLIAVHRSDPGLMLGYWRKPEAEREVFRGDWFVGGDVAEMDIDGYVWLHGRRDDLMNAQGYRVSPAEVEAVLSHAPGVADVAVAERKVRADVQRDLRFHRFRGRNTRRGGARSASCRALRRTSGRLQDP